MSDAGSSVLAAVATALDRRTRMLRTALGPLIATALEDPDVVEVHSFPTRRSSDLNRKSVV